MTGYKIQNESVFNPFEEMSRHCRLFYEKGAISVNDKGLLTRDNSLKTDYQSVKYIYIRTCLLFDNTASHKTCRKNYSLLKHYIYRSQSTMTSIQ